MAKYPDITHLKQGKTYSDPVTTAQNQGAAFTNTCKHIERHTTPDSKPGKADGHLGDKFDNKGPRLYAPINLAAAPNCYCGKGGSKRG
jgi:hypothetical protein